MRHITRQLYQSMQEQDQIMQGVSALPPDEFESRWRQACEAWEAELNSIKPHLSPAMRSLAEVTLHDGVVKSAGQSCIGCVELRVDATNNPWGPRGWFRIEFKGVREVEGLTDMVEDYWLYEEVHLHSLACFEYCVLLHRSEFRVVADDVIFEPLSESKATN